MTTSKTAKILSGIVEQHLSIPAHILFGEMECVELVLCSTSLEQMLIKAFTEGLKYNPGMHSYYESEISRN